MSPAPPRVSVVVVSYNTREHLLRCLAALDRNVGLPHEVVVVDNASDDGSAGAVREAHPSVRVLESGENLGFARACNRGVRDSRAPYLLFVNSDAEVRPGCVETLARILDGRPDVALAAPRTLNPDGTVQVSTGPRPTPLAEWRQRRLVRGVRGRDPAALRAAGQRHGREHEPGWVSGACLLARREALAAVGGFDEGFFLYQEDVDLCLRVRRAGWRVLFTPEAEAVHHLGRSMARAAGRARFEYDRSHMLLYRKHNGPLFTLLLRLYLLAVAQGRLLSSLGPGQARRERRRWACALFRLTLRGA